jgi:hypothetical protein
MVLTGPKISSGFFSDVYRGHMLWREAEITIRELNPNTDKTLFLEAVAAWRQLRSPYILPLIGGFSDPPLSLLCPFSE